MRMRRTNPFSELESSSSSDSREANCPEQGRKRGTCIPFAAFTLCILAVLLFPMINKKPRLQQSHAGREDLLSNSSSLESLKIVSMNIAMATPSREAPESWISDEENIQQIKALRKEILKTDPDIIALQECPDPEWSHMVFGPFGYVSVGTKLAHAGYVDLLFRKSLMQQVTTQNNDNHRLPMVAAHLVTGNHSEYRLMVASVHLEPFQEGSFVRQKQLDRMIEAAKSSSSALLFSGDTNMRDEEDKPTEEKLTDLWRAAGQDPSTRYSWDTMDHNSSAGGWHNRYYGSGTREYQRRYDRMYWRPISSSQIYSVLQSVQSFQLIANKPIDPSRPRHFLSDHFGLAAEINIQWRDVSRVR